MGEDPACKEGKPHPCEFASASVSYESMAVIPLFRYQMILQINLRKDSVVVTFEAGQELETPDDPAWN